MNMILDAAGLELTKTVLNLYRSKRYRKEAEVLADILLKAGVDAGSYIGAVENYADANGRSLATDRAVRELDRIAFTVYVMQSEAVYSADEVVHLLNLAREIKRELLNGLNEFLQSARTAPPVITNETAVASADDGNEQLSFADIGAVPPESVPSADEGGGKV